MKPIQQLRVRVSTPRVLLVLVAAATMVIGALALAVGAARAGRRMENPMAVLFSGGGVHVDGDAHHRPSRAAVWFDVGSKRGGDFGGAADGDAGESVDCAFERREHSSVGGVVVGNACGKLARSVVRILEFGAGDRRNVCRAVVGAANFFRRDGFFGVAQARAKRRNRDGVEFARRDFGWLCGISFARAGHRQLGVDSVFAVRLGARRAGASRRG